MHQDITFSTRDSYLSVILPLREKVEEIKEQDDGFYRIWNIAKRFNSLESAVISENNLTDDVISGAAMLLIPLY